MMKNKYNSNNRMRNNLNNYLITYNKKKLKIMK